jgi:hypothetical protein
VKLGGIFSNLKKHSHSNSRWINQDSRNKGNKNESTYGQRRIDREIDTEAELDYADVLIDEQERHHTRLTFCLNREAEIVYTLARHEQGYRHPLLPITTMDITRPHRRDTMGLISRRYCSLTPSSSNRLNNILDHKGWTIDSTAYRYRLNEKRIARKYDDRDTTHSVYIYRYNPDMIEVPIDSLERIPFFGIANELSTESQWFNKIREAYTISGDEIRRILRFLYIRPYLIEALIDVRKMLNHYFPGDSCTLKVAHNYDSNSTSTKEDVADLIVEVWTAADVSTAMFQLGKFDDEWWLDYLSGADEKWDRLEFGVDVAFREE